MSEKDVRETFALSRKQTALQSFKPSVYVCERTKFFYTPYMLGLYNKKNMFKEDRDGFRRISLSRLSVSFADC